MGSSTLRDNPASTAAATPGARAASRRIVDAPTRLAHALIGLSFVGAYLSAEGERWRALHTTLGWVLAGVLVFRVLYGLVGPRQARVALWFRKLAAAPSWLRSAARALHEGRPAGVPWRQGQNLLMAALIAALPLAMLPLLLSGLAPHLGWVTGRAGDALAELHEALGEALPVLVVAHVALVAGLSLRRRQNLARPMLDGRVPGTGPDLARHSHSRVAALLLVAVVGFIGWQWAGTPGGLVPQPVWAAANGPGHPVDDDHDDD
jgi:cytochrome b